MVARLRTLITITLLLLLSACGGGSGTESTFKASGQTDSAAPQVVSTTPSDNSLAVSDSAAIVLRFNESLKAYSVNFKLINQASNSEVEGFVNYRSELKSVVFTPREPLQAQTAYLAKLIGAEDLAGNQASPVDIAFTTEAVALERPNILIQPIAKNLFAGDKIDLRVVLSNLNDATSFAWYRDTATASGQSLDQFGNNLVIDAALASDSGYYYCRISNSAGAVQTIPVYVDVKKPLVVGQQPQSVTSLSGRSITFSGQFDGSENKTLQWFKDGQALEESAKYTGVDETILRVNSINSADAGRYHLTATTDTASVSTQAASLVVINPVAISQGLGAQTLAEQTQLNLSVNAKGTGPLQYSWFHNNVLLEQETQSSLRINAITTEQAGLYKVVVRNAYSSQTTTARITVLMRARISQQPIDVSVYAGRSASLSAVATGSELSYQWQKMQANQWQDITGATSPQLSFSAINSDDQGDYRVVIRNEVNTVISNTANVYVGQGASITTQPTAQLVQAGYTASFSVLASGENLQYEWRKDGQLIAGQNSAQLRIANVDMADQATYQCRVWNSNNSVNCAQATLTVAQSVNITKQPQSTTVYIGEWVNLSVDASGYEPRFRWFKNGTLLSAQTGKNLSLGVVTANDAGSYYAQAYNQFGVVDSATVVVSVKQASSIISQPRSQTINEGESINLSVNAQGDDLSYEWRHNGQLISSANASSLVINNADTAAAGTYTCRVWNANNSVNCNNAVVTIRASVSISSQTNSLRINEGQATTLSVVASGYQARYRWYKDNQVIASAANNQLSLNAIAPSDAGRYKCEVYNSFSSARCDAIDLSVVAKPVIRSASPSQTVQFGDNLTLAISATGTATLSYQWYKDGQVLAGETASELRLSNVQAAHLGAYVCRVSNGAGQVDSQAINITGVETYSVEVSWAKPTQREDGTALTDNEIDGYKVYMQVSSGEFELVETNLGANNTSAVVSNLYPGSYTFKVRTLDSDGQESEDSELQSIDL